MKKEDISNVEVCLAYREYQKNKDIFPYEILAKKFGCNEKLAYKACERASDWPADLIEYGVSLRTGWLTEKGEKLLSDNGF